MYNNLQKNNSPGNAHSLFEVLKKVMRQVDYQCLADIKFNRIDPLYKELCLIIAEVFLLNSESIIKINGSFVNAQLLKEVYSNLQSEHLKLVFENFHSVSGHVYNKKAYLRTALYNAFFELESTCVNDFCFNRTDRLTD